jgi:hypothetical protein
MKKRQSNQEPSKQGRIGFSELIPEKLVTPGDTRIWVFAICLKLIRVNGIRQVVQIIRYLFLMPHRTVYPRTLYAAVRLKIKFRQS